MSDVARPKAPWTEAECGITISGHAEVLAVGAHVHAGRAAEREEREAARIEPALHRRLVQQVVEEAVRELVHRRRRRDDIEPERLGDLLLERRRAASTSSSARPPRK